MELDDTAQSHDVLDQNAALADLEVGAQASITVDGGLKKTVLQKGHSKDRPEAGDEVEVHYTGTLEDGTKFDSSRDRDEPFTFTLKEGSVIKGWDLGVGTMKKGEKAILTCSPDYAYGPSGSPPIIPPNATLNFEVELLSWKSTKDILGDGGVMKSVVTPGVGWDKPADRDEVLVKFTAKVAEQPDAAPFAASPPEGTEFTVMHGLEGMNGVGRAVKTMKQEERAHMIIQPQYAYGALGRDGVVPANTPVEVDLELVSWKKVEDIFGTNGAVSKKTLSESREWKTPNEGTKVTLRLVGRLEDGTVFDEYPQGSELVYVTDDEVVCEGLDAAVMKMKKGERAEIIVRPPFSYPAGYKGNKAEVPPNAVLKYDVELVHYDAQKESFEMENEERVAAGDLWKEKGNKAYREGKIVRAVRLYEKALSYVAYDKGFPEALRVKSGAIKKSASLNLAAANLKQKDWREAIKNCDKALEADPNNTKALYRRAQAFMGEGDNVEAEQDVKKALLIAPGDPDLVALQKRLRACLKDEAQKQKTLYSKMFSKPLSKDEPQPPPQQAGPSGEQGGQDNSEAAPMEGLQESDTLPPGTQPAPKGSVLLEQI